MANSHGGYRKPGNPAPASGPGSLSRRTDGQVQAAPTGMNYGEHKAMMQQEAVAPMAATPDVPNIPINDGPAQTQPTDNPAMANVVPIGAPSSRPDEPITHGVNIGPGGGPEVLPDQHRTDIQQPGPMTQLLSRFAATDSSGAIANMLAFARAQGA